VWGGWAYSLAFAILALKFKMFYGNWFTYVRVCVCVLGGGGCSPYTYRNIPGGRMWAMAFLHKHNKSIATLDLRFSIENHVVYA